MISSFSNSESKKLSEKNAYSEASLVKRLIT
jgi:hypothetical protein